MTDRAKLFLQNFDKLVDKIKRKHNNNLLQEVNNGPILIPKAIPVLNFDNVITVDFKRKS